MCYFGLSDCWEMGARWQENQPLKYQNNNAKQAKHLVTVRLLWHDVLIAEAENKNQAAASPLTQRGFRRQFGYVEPPNSHVSPFLRRRPLCTFAACPSVFPPLSPARRRASAWRWRCLLAGFGRTSPADGECHSVSATNDWLSWGGRGTRGKAEGLLARMFS